MAETTTAGGGGMIACKMLADDTALLTLFGHRVDLTRPDRACCLPPGSDPVLVLSHTGTMALARYDGLAMAFFPYTNVEGDPRQPFEPHFVVWWMELGAFARLTERGRDAWSREGAGP